MNRSITFADRLKELRAAAKMTQHELAARSGVHRQTIATLETGERVPSWDTVQALARALGVDCKAFETLPAEAETPPAKKPTRKRKEKE
jgi:transcriptional regulator with XRE-family HTH domain